jgi:hypothetical protein
MSSEITAGLERKLRSVQDLIDSKQYKKALKQVNQHMKKTQHPMLLCFKALSLQKLGEEAEALSILEEVMAEKPSNSHLLSLIGIVYKELGRNDRLNQIQLEIFNQSPSKEKGEIVFNCFASEYNYKEQYNVAMKLYKSFNDPKYGLWAVESMILIAMHDKSNVKMLDLASLFLGKVKQTPEYANMREVAEIEIFIEENKGKYEKVVELLNKHRSIVPDAMIREAEGLEKLGRLPEALTLLNDLLSHPNCLDLKIFYKHSEISLKLQSFESWTLIQLQENPSFSLFEKIIQDISQSSSRKRSSRLGQFYIFAELLKSQKLPDSKSFLLEKLSEYLKTFFEIPSVVEDLKPVLIHLSESDSLSLISSISDFDLKSFSCQAELSKILTFLKLSFKFGQRKEDQQLISLYETSLSFEQPPKKGEHRQGDYFLLLRSLNLPLRSSASQCELEEGTKASKYNYFLKLQLIENLKETEFVRKVVEMYEGLDIKSVQHESLGYLVFSELNDWRLFKPELSKLLASCEKFHKYYALDLAETTSQAYFYSHLSQVLDFALFKEKIERSLYFNMTKVTSHYLELVKRLQEGTLKTNTSFLHLPLETFTLNIDENVLNDFIPINSPQTLKNHFGRWSELKFFEAERLAGAFVSEFQFEEEKSTQTSSKLLDLTNSLEGTQDFYKETYQVLGKFMAGLTRLKQGRAAECKDLWAQAFSTLGLVENKLKDFEFRQRSLKKELFEYRNFVADLKKIAFLFNTFAPVLALSLSFAKPLVPAEVSGNRKKKSSQVNVSVEFSSVQSGLMRIFEEGLNLLNNEELLLSIEQDPSVVEELSQVLLSSINKDEKLKEITQTRRILVKDLHFEGHSIKASLNVLFSKSR